MLTDIYDLTDNELSFYLAHILDYDPEMLSGVCYVKGSEFNAVRSWNLLEGVIKEYISSIKKDGVSGRWNAEAIEYSGQRSVYSSNTLSKACILAVVGSHCSCDIIDNHRSNVIELARF